MECGGGALMYAADCGLSSRSLRSAWRHPVWRLPRACIRISIGFPPLPATMSQDGGQEKQIELHRENFTQQLHLRALRVGKQHSHFVAKTLSRFTLDRPKLKHVIVDPKNTENRLVLLAEKISDNDLLDEKLALIKEALPFELLTHEIDLDYRYYTVEQVLREILPQGWKVPASFETVGHIAHLNLVDELLPYRKVIAEVFLDKNQPKIKTIVNKVGTISNEFRVPTWEILAGNTNLITEVKQHSATFRLDFGLVYWNSRLEFEHKRLSSLFQPGQVVLDLFAGIGPFAIPAAQRGCVVLANDLNPASVQYLDVNAKLNKVAGSVKSYNMDARKFMKSLQRREVRESTTLKETEDGHSNGLPAGGSSVSVTASNVPGTCVANSTHQMEQKLEKTVVMKKSNTRSVSQSSSLVASNAKPWELFHHVVMNLPASALEFLDVLQGLLSKHTWKGPMPQVHCYCFMRAAETTSDVVKRAESFLGGSISDPHVWTVRDVAPNKIMLCISFELPENVAFSNQALIKTAMGVDGEDCKSDVVTAVQSSDLQNKRPRTES